MRLAPSATSSSSVVDCSASAASSTCTLNIGVPSSPAFHRQRFFDLFKEEGTPRPRSGGASTSYGYNSEKASGRYLRQPADLTQVVEVCDRSGSTCPEPFSAAKAFHVACRAPADSPPALRGDPRLA